MTRRDVDFEVVVGLQSNPALPVVWINFPPDLPVGSLAVYPGSGNVVHS
jgi:hypothetical protein